MAVDYYPRPDLWYRPVIINGANKTIRVIEDLGGGSKAAFKVTIRESSAQKLDGPYYPTADSDPVKGSVFSNPSDPAAPPSRQILNGANDALTVSHIYDEIVDQLTTASDQRGNGLTYQLQSTTPSGSDHANCGIELTTDKQNLSIQIDFGVADAIDPMLFGFGRDKSDKTASGLTVTGPFARGVSWYSPVAASEKPHADSYEVFRTSSDSRHGIPFKWTERERERPMIYHEVAAAHIWAFDRAGRAPNQNFAGIPAGDNNNALEDFWDAVLHANRDIIIAHHRGPSSGRCKLSAGMKVDHELTVGRLTGPFGDTYAPHEESEPGPEAHFGEQYNLALRIGEADPPAYNTTNATPYRH